MKKNIWTSRQSLFIISILSYALFLFFFVGIRESNDTTYAKDLKHHPSPTPTLAATATQAPTATAMPTATRAPIATATTAVRPTVTPVPATIPRQRSKPTPAPQIQASPTSTVHPASATPTVKPSIATPTNAAATAVTTPGNTVTVTDATSSNQQQQAQDGENKNANIFMLSFAIGIPLFVLSGGALLLLWRRQMNQQRGARNTQAYPWMRGRENYSVLTIPQSKPFTNLTAGATGTLSAPGRSGLSSSETLFSKPAYAPSDFQSMVTDFSEQMKIPNPSLAATSPVPPRSIQLPLISDDLTLEEIASQAKTGLFVLLGREESLP